MDDIQPVIDLALDPVDRTRIRHLHMNAAVVPGDGERKPPNALGQSWREPQLPAVVT